LTTPRFFYIPFGSSGDLQAVPDTVQGDGSVSYPQGFGPAYSTPVSSGGLNVPRAQTNQLYFDITTLLNQIQTNGVPLWYNGVTYPLNAVVLYTDGNVYVSLKNSNTDAPTVAASWARSAPQAQGDFNKAINGNFAVNQRKYVTNTGLAAGVYAHDRWKAGSGGCTYTFSQSTPDTTINVTAGTLQQVISGNNLPDSTYTLSWSGTAQAQVNGGGYAASPITVSGLTPGSNATIEFSTGTVGLVQFQPGRVQTSFMRKLFSDVMEDCLFYFQRFGAESSADQIGVGGNSTTTVGVIQVNLVRAMRAAPSFSYSALSDLTVNTANSLITPTSLTLATSTTKAVRLDFSVASGLSAGGSAMLRTNTSAGYIDLSAEL
jgi:hypothetical protein